MQCQHACVTCKELISKNESVYFILTVAIDYIPLEAYFWYEIHTSVFAVI